MRGYPSILKMISFFISFPNFWYVTLSSLENTIFNSYLFANDETNDTIKDILEVSLVVLGFHDEHDKDEDNLI